MPAPVIQDGKDEFGTLRQVSGIASQVSGLAFQLVRSDVGHTPYKETAIDKSLKITAFVKGIID